MLKLGVWRRDQFFAKAPRSLAKFIYYRLSRSRVSLGLLSIPDEPSAEDIELFERLMPHVRLSSGIYRTTYKQRFRNLDPIVNAVLVRELAGEPQPVVEDWAASACLTSLEWFRSLCPLFPNLTFTASDLVFFLVGVEDRDSGDCFIVDENGKPLQYEKPPFVIRMDPPESRALPVNRIWYRHALRKWNLLSSKWARSHQWLNSPSESPLELDSLKLRKLSLIHPSVRRTVRLDQRFMLRRHSIFDRAPAKCHVIRTMNVLNKAYFSDERLLEGARNVTESLLPGGIWIVGRTIQEEPPVHEVSIFRREISGRLALVEQVGPGSEIQSLILNAR